MFYQIKSIYENKLSVSFILKSEAQFATNG